MLYREKSTSSINIQLDGWLHTLESSARINNLYQQHPKPLWLFPSLIPPPTTATSNGIDSFMCLDILCKWNHKVPFFESHLFVAQYYVLWDFMILVSIVADLHISNFCPSLPLLPATPELITFLECLSPRKSWWTSYLCGQGAQDSWVQAFCPGLCLLVSQRVM